MLREVNIARNYLVEKFGNEDSVPSGIYSVPIETSKGDSFMKVEITSQRGMIGFNLFKDEELTQDWHES